MPTYLVEAYMPHAQEARAAGRRARAAAEELSREGVPIHYVRTTFLPDDETCFHLFEAAYWQWPSLTKTSGNGKIL